MVRKGRILGLLLGLLWAGMATAQDAWVQIEARPTEADATQRADAYASRLSDVNGYRLASGWFAVALGPYAPDIAASRLAQLRLAGVVPGDSFLSDGSNYRGRFYGSGTATAALTGAEPAPPPPVSGEETPAEARAAEAALSRADREQVQIALRADGVYASGIDGDFGPGTRRAMALWQAKHGYEQTGVLTTLQRQTLVEGYHKALDSLGMEQVADARAGIAINMPKGLVRFDSYDPPFAHYIPATTDGVQVSLISETGDRDTLGALYAVMQTLRIVPVSGRRSLGRDDFTLTGQNDRITSYTYAQLTGGAIKGFTLVWPTGDEMRRQVALDAMLQSFTPTDGVLPDTAGAGEQDIDLFAGLEIRRPARSRSGIYVSNAGAVLTTAGAVQKCDRVTLGDDTDAAVTALDDTLGLALLTPKTPLAPISVAKLTTAEPRLQSDIAIAGYSFGGVLPAPSLTWGTLADVKGLDGNDAIQRLAVAAEPGDAGGPVFEPSGAVAGLVLDKETGPRVLPPDVAFAAKAPPIAGFLAAHGITPAKADPLGPDMAPEDLTTLAADMTVLVGCWN